MVKIIDVELLPLTDKYYETCIGVEVEDIFGFKQYVTINLFGGDTYPSKRELDKGWEPEYGMDHVETEATYTIAKIIIEALKKHGH